MSAKSKADTPRWWGLPFKPRRLWLWANTMEEPLNEESRAHMLCEVEPSALGLSKGLERRLEAWSSRFMDQAPMWEWESLEEKIAFRIEGFRLAADVQAELGPSIEVFYHDRLQPQDSFFSRVERE